MSAVTQALMQSSGPQQSVLFCSHGGPIEAHACALEPRCRKARMSYFTGISVFRPAAPPQSWDCEVYADARHLGLPAEHWQPPAAAPQ